MKFHITRLGSFGTRIHADNYGFVTCSPMDLARVATVLRDPTGTWEVDGYASPSLGVAVALSLLASAEKLDSLGQWSGR